MYKMFTLASDRGHWPLDTLSLSIPGSSTVKQTYGIIELYDYLHCVQADDLVARQFFLLWQDMQLAVVGDERPRQLIITKIGATVDVKRLKLFLLN